MLRPNSFKLSTKESFKNSKKNIAFMFFTPNIPCYSLSFYNKKVEKIRFFRCRSLESLKYLTMSSFQSVLFKKLEGL